MTRSIHVHTMASSERHLRGGLVDLIDATKCIIALSASNLSKRLAREANKPIAQWMRSKLHGALGASATRDERPFPALTGAHMRAHTSAVMLETPP